MVVAYTDVLTQNDFEANGSYNPDGLVTQANTPLEFAYRVLPKEKIDPTYKRLRWQVFFGIFIGYAGYYLVRKNFTMAMPELQELGFDKGMLGVALSANAIAYGISKFIMGGVSDRSSARKSLRARPSRSRLLFGSAK